MRSNSGQICKKCREKNPKKAKFCMSCGFNMKSRSNKLWHGRILSLKKGFNQTKIVNAILAEIGPEYIGFDVKRVTEEDVRQALACLTQKSQQYIIRLTGAANDKTKTYNQVAAEVGVKVSGVRSTVHTSFFRMAMKLRELRPNSKVQKARKRSHKEFQRVINQVRQM